MATSMNYSATSSWANENVHVDTSIGDGSQFVNAAHTMIYTTVSGSTASSIFTPVGVIQGWSATEQRQVEEVWELGSDIKYIVPGRTTGQIAVTRMLINGPDLTNVLYGTFTNGVETASQAGTQMIVSLKQINQPIDIMFVTYNNDTQSTEHMMQYFRNCWIVARQESITSNAVVIAENCTIVYDSIDTAEVTPLS